MKVAAVCVTGFRLTKKRDGKNCKEREEEEEKSLSCRNKLVLSKDIKQNLFSLIVSALDQNSIVRV